MSARKIFNQAPPLINKFKVLSKKKKLKIKGHDQLNSKTQNEYKRYRRNDGSTTDNSSLPFYVLLGVIFSKLKYFLHPKI